MNKIISTNQIISYQIITLILLYQIPNITNQLYNITYQLQYYKINLNIYNINLISQQRINLFHPKNKKKKGKRISVEFFFYKKNYMKKEHYT
jgi:hypothetical protein